MSQEAQTPSSVALLRLLCERTTEHAFVLLDTTGRIVGWLPGAQNLFGYLPNEILGQPVSKLFTPENVKAGMVEYEQEVARTDVEAEDDRWMLRKDGFGPPAYFRQSATRADNSSDSGKYCAIGRTCGPKFNLLASKLKVSRPQTIA